MNRRAKVISIVLLAVCFFSSLANVSLVVAVGGQTTDEVVLCLGGKAKKGRKISPEELQRIKAAVPAKAIVRPSRPRKLLVFNLCEGYEHSAIIYGAKALEIMGKKTGAFEVVQSSDMSIFKPENLGRFDAVCFNNSSGLKFEDPALRKSLMDFVKGGKGIVGIHAATDSFGEWPEAAEMMGALFDNHPWRSKDKVWVKVEEPEHPLCAAFGSEGFGLMEEIYQFKAPYSRENLRVLLSLDTSKTNMNKSQINRKDGDFAISWVRSLGKGRVLYCSLGHNHHIFWTPQVLQHYLAGIQFALGDLVVDTTPTAQRQLGELDDLLVKVAAYEYGQSRIPLTELSDFVHNAYGSAEELRRIEGRLLEFLRSDATLASKQFVCKQLSIIGSDQAVPTLSAMLTRAATCDMARYALERIPGTAADKALREALPKVSGKEKIGVINTLGQRGDSQSAFPLRRLIYDSDQAVAVAAVSALGQIDGSRAAETLAELRGQTSGELRLLASDAYLKCAERFAAQGEQSKALAIYRQLYAPDEPEQIRIAALGGIVAAMKEDAVEVILDVLKGEDQAMQSVAIEFIRRIPEARMDAVIAELPNLSVTSQAQLLSVLADRGDTAALPMVVMATKSRDESVRTAALRALGKLGDASTVAVLTRAAAKTSGAEQEAARQSLYRLRGPDIDETILGCINRAEPGVKVELIHSIGQRRVDTAVETLLKTAQDSETKVQLESFKVLRIVAGPEHLPALIGLLIKIRSEAVRSEAERCVTGVAHKIPKRGRQADAVLAVLSSVKEATARRSLLRVLGKIGIGDDNALPVFSAALNGKDIEGKIVAIRALSGWPRSAAGPMADLLKVARVSDEKKHRVLALRGFIRLVGLDSERPAEETVKMYREAMGLAEDVSEKRMMLSGLANVKSFSAMEMVAACLDDELLRGEAEAAVVKIGEAIRGRDHPQQTKAILQKVFRSSKDDSLRKEAEKLIQRL